MVERKGEHTEFSFRGMEIEVLDELHEMVFRLLKISTSCLGVKNIDLELSVVCVELVTKNKIR